MGDVDAAILGEHDHILDTHAELSGQVNARLRGQAGAGGNGLVPEGAEPGVLVDLDAQGMAEAVTEAVAVARFIDDIPRGTVNLFTYNSLQDRGRFETTEKG